MAKNRPLKLNRTLHAAQQTTRSTCVLGPLTLHTYSESNNLVISTGRYIGMNIFDFSRPDSNDCY